MRELVHYYKTLRTRGLDVAARELRSRFIRGPVCAAVRRVMDACERHNAVFTFFITGNSAMVNKAFIREILSRGHAVECHGYNHLRFDTIGEDLARRDLELAVRVFREVFDHELTGFRAPYLGMNDAVAALLRDMGFGYSSSLMGREATAHGCGLPEFPIAACDWHTLIRDARPPEAFLEELRAKMAPGAVFELHPWRVGQKKYAWILEELLAGGGPPSVDMAELRSAGKSAMSLSGDLGELSLMEIAMRAFFQRGTDYRKVSGELDRHRGVRG